MSIDDREPASRRTGSVSFCVHVPNAERVAPAGAEFADRRHGIVFQACQHANCTPTDSKWSWSCGVFILALVRVAYN